MIFLNLYGPNNDDSALFEMLHDFGGQNEDEEFILGEDFNNVINPDFYKFGGYMEHIRNVVKNLSHN